jgi:hypothetical protein
MAAPNVSVTTNDTTSAASPENTSIFLVQAITERGVVNKPIRIASELEFYREFGKVIHSTGELCIRALRLGAILYINPVHHYTTISDASTIEGTKAEVELFTGDLIIKAAEVGQAYNGILVSIVSPQSRRTGYFDILVTNPTDPTFANEFIQDIAQDLTVSSIINLNEKLKTVQFVLDNPVTLVAANYAALSGGIKDITTIVIGDFVGSSVSKTGLNAFVSVHSSIGFHIVNFNPVDLISNVLDAAYVAYGEKTIRQVHLKVKESTAGKIVDYRNGTGTYTHQPLDSLFTSYWAGTIKVPSSADASNIINSLSPMGDYVGCLAKKDAVGAWLSVGDIDYGRLSPDVLALSAFTDEENDLLYDNDINFIKNSSLGFKFSGNRSLYRNKTKVSSKQNVSSLTIYLMRWLRSLAENYLEKQNDVITWGNFYRAGRPTMTLLEDRRAIEKTEGKGWLWLGDQEAKSLDDLKYNKKTDITNGIYKMQLQIIPKASIEVINILVTKTNEIVNVQLA